MGGKNDPTKFYIEPTVVQNVTEKDSLMQEEIFGPILPLVTCESFSEAVDFINSREIPLAGYCFSKGNLNGVPLPDGHLVRISHAAEKRQTWTNREDAPHFT